MAKLKELKLGGTKLTDTGLAQIRDLTTLTLLDLRRTRITDAGLDHLHGLQQLKSLDLQGTLISPERLAALRKTLPECKIEF